MNISKKHFLFLAAALGVITLYFVLRLTSILSLPLFTDEAIYIRWAQIAKQDASWRFISLVDGKQPSFVWIAMIMLKFFKEPLLAGRMVSVLAGVFTTIGLFFLGNEVFRKKQDKKIFSFTKETVMVGLLSSFLYVIYPFGLVYDRMAMYDSLVGAFAVWSLFLLFLLVRFRRLDLSLISGMVIGGGLLTKTSAFFSLGSMPFLFAIFDWSKKDLKGRITRFASLCIVTFVVANIIYAVLRLSPFFYVVATKDALFVYPLREWITHPLTYFSSNLNALIDWFVTYFSVPSIILLILSFLINRSHFFEKSVLVLWFIFPFTYLAFFGKLIYPRFILFMTLPLIPLLSYSIYNLLEKYKKRYVWVLILFFSFAVYIYVDIGIVYDFKSSHIPFADKNQYINNWSAGNGVAQSVQFFTKQAENQKIYIVTEGTFGLMPYGLEMYLVNNPNVKIEGLWPIKDIPPANVVDMISKVPVYAIFYQPCPGCGGPGGNIPPLWHATKIASYRQGISQSYYSIYKLLP